MRTLIVGAAPCEHTACVTLVSELASDVDVVIAVDGGAELCSAAGVVPQLIIGDLDSLSDVTRIALEARGALVQRFPADKNESDLDLAILEARRRHTDELVMTGVTGGRADHFLAAVGSLVRASDMSPRIEEAHVAIWVVDAARHPSVSLTGRGRRLSIVPVEGDAVITATGVQWPLHAERIAPLSSRGLSNVITGDVASIRSLEGVAVLVADDRS